MSDFFAPFEPGDPTLFPVGSRVVIDTDFEDMHFFRKGATGTVIRLTGRAYLGVVVELDQPFRCDHGTYQHDVDSFNFNPRSLRLAVARA